VAVQATGKPNRQSLTTSPLDGLCFRLGKEIIHQLGCEPKNDMVILIELGLKAKAR
jgi:hypothetical protein